MDCYYHHSTKSVGSCERCNRPICSDCVVTFKNRMRYIDRTEIQRGRELDPDYEYDRSEELNWCLPCYYAHFSPELLKNDNFLSLLIDSILETIIFGIILFASITILSYWAQNLSLLNILFFPISLFGLLIASIAVVIVLYQRKRRSLDEKLAKLNIIKDRFLSSTNVGTIDLPIDCFYCKYEIDAEAMACLNLNCTLGETISTTGPEVEIQAVNSNYGFFDTLRKLPKYPEEEKEKK